jgi:hypothetical protein
MKRAREAAGAVRSATHQFVRVLRERLKAAVFELTKRPVTREFFAADIVRELERRSDYWVEQEGA